MPGISNPLSARKTREAVYGQGKDIATIAGSVADLAKHVDLLDKAAGAGFKAYDAAFFTRGVFGRLKFVLLGR